MTALPPLDSKVGHLTCYYWATNGKCKFPDGVCKYAHFHTGFLAEQPIRLAPGQKAMAGHNLRTQVPYAHPVAVLNNLAHPAIQPYHAAVQRPGSFPRQMSDLDTATQKHHRVGHDLPLLPEHYLCPNKSRPASLQRSITDYLDLFPGLQEPKRYLRPSALDMDDALANLYRTQIGPPLSITPSPPSARSSAGIFSGKRSTATEATLQSPKRLKSEDEFVWKMFEELMQLQANGDWKFGNQGAYEASKACARTWRKLYGDFSLF